MNEVRGVNHFTTQVPAAPVTYGRRTGPFKPSLLGRLSPRLEACWTTFPRVPRDRCAGALGKLGRLSPPQKLAGRCRPAPACPPVLLVPQSELQ